MYVTPSALIRGEKLTPARIQCHGHTRVFGCRPKLKFPFKSICDDILVLPEDLQWISDKYFLSKLYFFYVSKYEKHFAQLLNLKLIYVQGNLKGLNINDWLS